MTLHVAVCQFAAGNDVAVNIERCVDLVAASAARGAQLAILPEQAMYVDVTKTFPGAHGEPLDGPFVNAIARAAKAHDIAVLVGMSERIDDDARDSNTIVAISPRGDVLGQYRKIHMFDAFGYRESDRFRPAEIGEPLIFDVAGVRVGAAICYDLRFPEIFRWLADAGAQVIALPAAWVAGPAKEDQWLTLIKARAIENTVYLAAANQTGPVLCGQSVIADPMGIVLANAAEGVGIATACVDLDRLAAIRRLNPSLANRRFTVTPA